MKYIISIISCVIILSLQIPVSAAINKSNLPPLLGSEQVIFLYYALSGDTPPYNKWSAADKRSRGELERLYKVTAKRTDLKQFHRELELALYDYDAKTKCQPLGAIKATYLSTPLAEQSNLEIHVDNEKDFRCWNISSDKLLKVKRQNNNNVRYQFISVLEVQGVNKTAPKTSGNKVLNLHIKRIEIYTKDKKVHLTSLYE